MGFWLKIESSLLHPLEKMWGDNNLQEAHVSLDYSAVSPQQWWHSESMVKHHSAPQGISRAQVRNSFLVLWPAPGFLALRIFTLPLTSPYFLYFSSSSCLLPFWLNLFAPLQAWFVIKKWGKFKLINCNPYVELLDNWTNCSPFLSISWWTGIYW